jgi:hypothetical protein
MQLCFNVQVPLTYLSGNLFEMEKNIQVSVIWSQGDYAIL